jgi:hypothetical protein
MLSLKNGQAGVFLTGAKAGLRPLDAPPSQFAAPASTACQTAVYLHTGQLESTHGAPLACFNLRIEGTAVSSCTVCYRSVVGQSRYAATGLGRNRRRCNCGQLTRIKTAGMGASFGMPSIAVPNAD